MAKTYIIRTKDETLYKEFKKLQLTNNINIDLLSLKNYTSATRIIRNINKNTDLFRTKRVGYNVQIFKINKENFEVYLSQPRGKKK